METEARAVLHPIKASPKNSPSNYSKRKKTPTMSCQKFAPSPLNRASHSKPFISKRRRTHKRHSQIRGSHIRIVSPLQSGLSRSSACFFTRWPGFSQTTRFQALQLISSKFLIFAVLGYMLVMSARNYASHKHNAVVNRHRQNALLTYRTLASASAEKEPKILF